MSIADKLTALQETKTAIKTAIEGKGQSLDGVPFTEYAAKIAAIVSGGGGSEGDSDYVFKRGDVKFGADNAQQIVTHNLGVTPSLIFLYPKNPDDIPASGTAAVGNTVWYWIYVKNEPLGLEVMCDYQGHPTNLTYSWQPQAKGISAICGEATATTFKTSASGTGFKYKAGIEFGWIAVAFDEEFKGSGGVEVNTSYGDKAIAILNKTVTEITPQDIEGLGLTSVNNYGFYQCTALQSFISSVAQQISLWSNAFDGCTALKEVQAYSLVGGASAVFNGCTALEKVVLLNQCNMSGNSLFRNCSSLKVVDLSRFTAVPTIHASGAFVGVPETCTIIIPDSISVDTWKRTTNWVNWADKLQFVNASNYVD